MNHTLVFDDKPVVFRPYQRQTIDAWHDFVRSGGQRGLVVSATGTGKTTIIGGIVRDALESGAEATALLMAHREELLGQLSDRIVQMCPGESVATYSGRNKCLPGPRVVAASVQSIGILGSSALDWLYPRLAVCDEAHHACFVPGTKVDGRNIEEISVGDLVRSFDHPSSRAVMKRVTCTFASKPSYLLRIRLADGQSFICTHDHPLYLHVEGCAPGYMPAWRCLTNAASCYRITPMREGNMTGDEAKSMRRVRKYLRSQKPRRHRDTDLLSSMPGKTTRGQGKEGLDDLLPLLGVRPMLRSLRIPQPCCRSERARILLGGMSGRLGGIRPFSADVFDKQKTCVCPNEDGQPNVERVMSLKDEAVDFGAWLLAKGSRRQRPGANGSPTDDFGGPRLAHGTCGQDKNGTRKRLPDLLQARRGQPQPEDRRGTRRKKPLITEPQRAGRQAGRIPGFVRVASVEVLEPGSDGTFGGLCPQGLVYNLEVEDNHNYFVQDGILVHNCAQSYQNAFKRFGCYDDEGTWLLGVTATPHRLDNKRLFGGGGIFETVVFKYDIVQAIRDGYLVDLRGYRAKADFNLDGVKTVAGDYNQHQLEERVNTEPVNELAFKSWYEKASDRPTIVFCAGVDHAKAMAEIFRSRGFTAEAVWGEMPRDAREAAIAGFQSGKIQILCNRDILTEGFDAWRCSCVLMIRPTQSWSLFTQICGRGLRHLPGLIEGLGTPVERREAIKGSVKPDCVSEGTLVLTDCGEVPIESVTTDMKVWDGEEFVSHGGTICRGEKTVIDYCGLVGTPDHKIWTAEGWKPLGQCALEQTPVSVTGIGGSPIREADGHYRRSGPQGRIQPAIPASPMRLRPGIRKAIRSGCEAPKRLSPMWETKASANVARQQMHRCPATMLQPQKPSLFEIWRSRYRVQIRRPDCYGGLGSGKPWAGRTEPTGPHRQFGPLRTRKPPMGVGLAKPEQHPQKAFDPCYACLPNGASRGDLRRRDADATDRPRAVLDSNSPEVPRLFIETQRRVWDIVNAGPRHRFTAAGILVSNCVVIDIVGATAAHNVGERPDGKTTPSIQGLFDLPECMDLQGKSVADAVEEFAQLPEIVQAAAFKRRTDFAGLSAVLTQVEMLSEIGVPDEVVEAGGDFYWMQVGDGHMIVDCGGGGKNQSAVLETDFLGGIKLHLRSEHRDQSFDMPDDMGQAIRQAERVIRQEFFGVHRIADRRAPWRKSPVTDAQKNLLSRFGIDPEVSASLDRGTASAFITHLQRQAQQSGGQP